MLKSLLDTQRIVKIKEYNLAKGSLHIIYDYKYGELYENTFPSIKEKHVELLRRTGVAVALLLRRTGKHDLGVGRGKGEGTFCFFLFVIASASEAISFVIGYFRDYFVVWFLKRTDGIASPAFGGFAMTMGMNNPG